MHTNATQSKLFTTYNKKKETFSGIKIPLLLQMDLHEIWYYQHKIRILTVQSPEIGKTKYPSL